MYNNTTNEISELKKFFHHNLDMYNFLNNELLFLYKIIISLLDNIHNNFLIKKIGNEEFNKLLSEVDTIYSNHSEISNKVSIELINDDMIYEVKNKIKELTNEIKEFTFKSSSFSIITMLQLFYGKDWDSNIENIDMIYFYNDIFIPSSCIIENKNNYLDELYNVNNGHVMVKKLIAKKNNAIEELNGARIIIYMNKKVMSLNGYFKNDSINIIKNSKFFKEKKNLILELFKLEVIPPDFRDNYLNQISLRNYCVKTNEEIKDMVVDAYTKEKYYKNLSLSSLLFSFSNSNFEKQREMLTILVLSDSRSAGLASLLYDVLLKKDDSNRAKQLYLSLNISIQKLFDVAFDEFNKNIKELKQMTEDDVPYDKRILALNINDKVKSKAMDKFKNVNGGGLFGGGGDNKAQQWLDGFLKIPFGIYKENPIISFLDNFNNKISNFHNLLSKNNTLLYNDLNQNGTPNTDFLIDKYINKVNDCINNSIKYNLDNLESQTNIVKHSKLLINEWNNYKSDRIKYINDVRDILNDSVYGNQEGKKQIECLLGQWINGDSSGAILGFQGPPGVGKTTLAKKGLSKCLKDDNEINRPFAFITLGGSSNGSTLEGHNYTYVGSTWGRIVDILIETKCMNPIIFFDELDKVSHTEHGKEIIGILTHLTDVTQNDTFNDKYFSGIDFDISKALIIFSYNDPSLIDPILRDRITEIRINPLTTKDKINICRDFLFPEILGNLGYKLEDITISDNNLVYLIETYTFEAGVRKIKEKLIEIFRVINLERLYGENIVLPYEIKFDKLEEILSKKQKIIFKKIAEKPHVGLVNGLYATTAGVGGLTIIESIKTYSDTKFSLELTGNQGDVMKESMKCAKTIAWNILPNKIKSKIEDDWKNNGSWGLHIHTPEAATPKDGPSAGGAITLSIISQLSGIPVKNTIAMTGEIDLCGNIKQIGGLLSKLNGAKKAGVKLALFPQENMEDVIQMRNENLSPEDENFEVKAISSIYEILDIALVENDIEFNNTDYN